MLAQFREFQVVLRYTVPPATAAGVQPQFVTIVSAEDADDAKVQADKVVQQLLGLVSIVSIEPRPDGYRQRGE